MFMLDKLYILNIIDELRVNTGLDNPVYFFTHGGCYRFAKMLQNEIGGEIYYIKSYQHFVLYYNGLFYDVTGNVTKYYKNEKMLRETEMTDKQLKGFLI